MKIVTQAATLTALVYLFGVASAAYPQSGGGSGGSAGGAWAAQSTGGAAGGGANGGANGAGSATSGSGATASPAPPEPAAARRTARPRCPARAARSATKDRSDKAQHEQLFDQHAAGRASPPARTIRPWVRRRAPAPQQCSADRHRDCRRGADPSPHQPPCLALVIIGATDLRSPDKPCSRARTSGSCPIPDTPQPHNKPGLSGSKTGGPPAVRSTDATAPLP